MVEQNRAWLERAAQQLAGHHVAVAALQRDAASAPGPASTAAAPAAAQPEGGSKAGKDKQAVLRDQAMADSGVQALLEAFPAEIRDVEEMEK
jgi:hypothetical protein